MINKMNLKVALNSIVDSRVFEQMCDPAYNNGMVIRRVVGSSLRGDYATAVSAGLVLIARSARESELRPHIDSVFREEMELAMLSAKIPTARVRAALTRIELPPGQRLKLIAEIVRE